MNVSVVRDAEELAKRAADLVAEAIGSHATLRLVLAGGTTPVAAYRLLAKRDLPWGRVTVLFGDERCVPPSDRESNYFAAFEALLRHVHPASVHRIPGELGAEAAAALYGPVVAVAPLDLVLLGVGPDGHTASLFPGNSALEAEGEVTPVHDAPKPPADRVTLTLGALKHARRVVVLAAGADKAEAVRLAQARRVPAGLIPHAEWIVAHDAASALER